MISNKNMMDQEFSRENAVREKAFSPALLHVLDIINQGYTVVRGTTSFTEKCDITRRAFYRFKERNAGICAKHADGNGHLSQLANLHCGVSELVNLYSAHSLVTEILDYFLGEAVVYTSLYFEQGSLQDIRRDTPHFCTAPEHLYLNAWFALEDVDDQNGALKIVPKGHALPPLDRERILRKVYRPGETIDPRSIELWNVYQAELTAQYKDAGLTEQEIHVKKGDVILWHPDTPYGNALSQNRLRARNSVVMRVTPPDIQVGLQDVFYGGRTLPAEPALWQYHSAGTRRYIDHRTINFVDQADYSLYDFSF